MVERTRRRRYDNNTASSSNVAPTQVQPAEQSQNDLGTTANTMANNGVNQSGAVVNPNNGEG